MKNTDNGSQRNKVKMSISFDKDVYNALQDLKEKFTVLGKKFSIDEYMNIIVGGDLIGAGYVPLPNLKSVLSEQIVAERYQSFVDSGYDLKKAAEKMGLPEYVIRTSVNKVINSPRIQVFASEQLDQYAVKPKKLIKVKSVHKKNGYTINVYRYDSNLKSKKYEAVNDKNGQVEFIGKRLSDVFRLIEEKSWGIPLAQ